MLLAKSAVQGAGQRTVGGGRRPTGRAVRAVHERGRGVLIVPSLWAVCHWLHASSFCVQGWHLEQACMCNLSDVMCLVSSDALNSYKRASPSTDRYRANSTH